MILISSVIIVPNSPSAWPNNPTDITIIP